MQYNKITRKTLKDKISRISKEKNFSQSEIDSFNCIGNVTENGSFPESFMDLGWTGQTIIKCIRWFNCNDQRKYNKLTNTLRLINDESYRHKRYQQYLTEIKPHVRY